MPFPSPGDLPDPEIKCRSSALHVDSLPSEPPGCGGFDLLWSACGGRSGGRLVTFPEGCLALRVDCHGWHLDVYNPRSLPLPDEGVPLN